MSAGGDFGNDATEACVLIHRRANHVGKQFVAAYDSNAGFVTARLDAQNDWLLFRQFGFHHKGINAIWLVILFANADLFETKNAIELLRDGVVCTHLKQNLASTASLGLCGQGKHNFATDAKTTRIWAHSDGLNICLRAACQI